MKRERDNVVVTITVKAITKQKQLTTYTSADYKPFIQNNPNPILKNKIKFISNKQFKLIIIFKITFPSYLFMSPMAARVAGTD